MLCKECQENLSAWVDLQLDSAQRVEIEQHLESCTDCQSLLDELQQLDAQLRECFEEDRHSSQRVTARVLNQLPLQQVDGHPASAQPAHWRNIVLAMAAGFLIAFFIWRPKPADDIIAPDLVEKAPRPKVAQLAVLTGPVEMAKDAKLEWFSCPSPSEVPAGGRVRTPVNRTCELTTESQATIRLASATTMGFDEPDNVSLESGRLWCQTDKPLDVKTPVSYVCVEGVCDIRYDDGTTEVLVLDGEASIKGTHAEEKITAPKRVTLTADSIKKDILQDPVVATSWINEILVRKGETDAELASRVDQLLAAIGRAKVELLYEKELRNLGDSCSKPLSKFIVGCSNTPPDIYRREKAAKILADVAGPNSIPDLVELLGDVNGNVRYHAARCLERLAGRNVGATPEQWRNMAPDQQKAELQLWKSWYDEFSPKMQYQPYERPSGKMKI